jgi:hypothetical protein
MDSGKPREFLDKAAGNLHRNTSLITGMQETNEEEEHKEIGQEYIEGEGPKKIENKATRREQSDKPLQFKKSQKKIMKDAMTPWEESLSPMHGEPAKGDVLQEKVRHHRRGT